MSLLVVEKGKISVQSTMSGGQERQRRESHFQGKMPSVILPRPKVPDAEGMHFPLLRFFQLAGFLFFFFF